MGQEILYCSRCQVRIRSADFERERAYRINGAVSCFKCARDVIHSLPPDTVKQLLEQIAAKEEAAEKKKSSTSRILRISELKPLKPQTVRAAAGRSSPGPSGGWAATLIVGIVAVVAAAFLVSSGSDSPPRRPPPTTPPTPPREVAGVTPAVRPVEPPPAAAPVPEKPPSAGTFDAEATESLARARTFARNNPEDWAGQLRLYELAAWDAGGTALIDTARRELDEVKKNDRELARAELPGILEKSRQDSEREEFGHALTTLRKGRAKHGSPEWTGTIDDTEKSVRQRMTDLYASLRPSAGTSAQEAKALR